MKNNEIKKLLIEECIKRHRATADTYIASMEEAQQSANEYGNPEDWFDTYKSDLLNKRDMLGRQLAKVLDEIQILESIDTEKEWLKVSFGAVVITKDLNMFVSIGLGKVEVKNESYFVISPTVPVFVAMRDCKKGDTYDFRGKKTKILDVF
jgi:hypothetical protein